jgi:hypothetical protein
MEKSSTKPIPKLPLVKEKKKKGCVGSEVTSKEERKTALALRTKCTDKYLKKLIDKCEELFEPKRIIGEGDWLFCQKEIGQTFE